jgi:rhodanese-related sulfurtransferase
MPAPNTISIEKLIRLIGTPKGPTLIDVRPEDAFDADPYLIPSSRHRPFERVSSEAPGSQSTVVICQDGTSLSQGVAAWLRTRGVPAEVLDGGFQAWKRAELPLVPLSKLPPLDAQSRTVGNPRSSEDRPDRLSLAHSSLRRSTRRISVCTSIGCRGSGRAFWRRTIRHRGCLLEPSW